MRSTTTCSGLNPASFKYSRRFFPARFFSYPLILTMLILLSFFIYLIRRELLVEGFLMSLQAAKRIRNIRSDHGSYAVNIFFCFTGKQFPVNQKSAEQHILCIVRRLKSSVKSGAPSSHKNREQRHISPFICDMYFPTLALSKSGSRSRLISLLSAHPFELPIFRILYTNSL